MDNVAERVIKLEAGVERIEKRIDDGLSKPCEREVADMIKESSSRDRSYTDHQVQLIVSNTKELFSGFELKVIDTINNLSSNVTDSFDKKLDKFDEKIEKVEKKIENLPKEMAWWIKFIVWGLIGVFSFSGFYLGVLKLGGAF